MKRVHVLLLLLLGSVVLYAQEQQRLANVLILDRLEVGASVPFVMEGTTADGFEMTWLVDPSEDMTMIWPAAKGSSGQQLTTDGVAGVQVLSWASAASSRENKNIDGRMSPDEALRQVLQTPIYKFHYKRDAKMSTQDFDTQYVGPMAEEAGWAMHYNRTTVNPVNTLGYTTLSIQAQQAQIDALKADLVALKKKGR